MKPRALVALTAVIALPLLVIGSASAQQDAAATAPVDLLRGSAIAPTGPVDLLRGGAIAPTGPVDLLRGSAVLPGASQAGPSVSSDQRIVVNADTCAALAALPNSADVAYKPGVDATGRSVAPADLAGAAPPIATSFPIEINVDLKKRFGIPAADTLFQGLARVGYVTVDGDRVFMNGQPISGGEQAILSEACRTRHR